MRRVIDSPNWNYDMSIIKKEVWYAKSQYVILELLLSKKRVREMDDARRLLSPNDRPDIDG